MQMHTADRPKLLRPYSSMSGSQSEADVHSRENISDVLEFFCSLLEHPAPNGGDDILLAHFRFCISSRCVRRR